MIRGESINMQAILSVLVPAYNEGEYIESCIESIESQETSFPIEIVVCDDASTDDTYDVLQEIHSDNIQIIQNEENQGIIETRNRLLNFASGQYFVQIDADSTLKPGLLSAIYNKLNSSNQIVFGKVDVKNTSYLHPTATNVGKIRGRGTWYGGACFGSVTKKFIESGGFDKEMLGAEVQELKQRAETRGWSVSYLENTGVESNFPTQIWPVLSRKVNSARTHIRQYTNTPENFSGWEVRGPVFWTVIIFLLLSSTIFSPFALIGMLLLIVPLYQYGRDTPLAVSISGRTSFLVLYPLYQIGSGLARTVGVWISIDTLGEILLTKYIYTS